MLSPTLMRACWPVMASPARTCCTWIEASEPRKTRPVAVTRTLPVTLRSTSWTKLTRAMTMLSRAASVLKSLTTGAMLTLACTSASESLGAPPTVLSVMRSAVTDSTL